MWMYENMKPVDYENPAYKKGSTTLPRSIFDQLIENVYEPETVTFEVDGLEETFYSQAIPSNTDGNRSKI